MFELQVRIVQTRSFQTAFLVAVLMLIERELKVLVNMSQKLRAAASQKRAVTIVV